MEVSYCDEIENNYFFLIFNIFVVVFSLFTESNSEMVITWSTMDSTNDSIIEYSLDNDVYQAKGIWNLFVDGGKKKHHQFIHKV